MQRAFYSGQAIEFIQQNEDTILGELARNNPFSLEDSQRNAWLEEIRILKEALSKINKGYIIFEYTIPRIGSRIDAVYIVDGLVFLLEFKIGAHKYARHAVDQVTDYALDLQNFHKASHDRLLVPILIATKAPDNQVIYQEMKPGILDVIKCNQSNIAEEIQVLLSKYRATPLDAMEWMSSPYSPTPTIIEAAQALYRGHGVTDISRNDASAINLYQTTKAINEIIEKSKREKRKSICFITGVYNGPQKLDSGLSYKASCEGG